MDLGLIRGNDFWDALGNLREGQLARKYPASIGRFSILFRREMGAGSGGKIPPCLPQSGRVWEALAEGWGKSAGAEWGAGWQPQIRAGRGHDWGTGWGGSGRHRETTPNQRKQGNQVTMAMRHLMHYDRRPPQQTLMSCTVS
jgi:hypothetical protein